MLPKTKTSPASFRGSIWMDGRFLPGEFHISDGIIREGRRGPATEAAYIIPPMSDPHVHGGWGMSFREEDFLRLEKKLRRTGIGLAVPTLDNDTLPRIESAAAAFLDYRRKHPDTIFPFLRVEGPFISRRRKGFQNEKYILAADDRRIEAFLSIDGLRMFTFAPEVPGTERLVREALKRNRIPSVGHSDAGYAEFLPFYRMGVRHMTHFPNAMRGLHHRDIGLLGTGFLLEDLHLEVVADGVHNCREFLELVIRWAHARVSLVSDMIAPAHARLSQLEGRAVVRKGNAITTAEGMLAGGGTGVPEQAALLAAWGHPRERIVLMAAENARRFLGIRRPELKAGEPADFLLCDEALRVKAVYFQGVRMSDGRRRSSRGAAKEGA